MPCVSVLRVCCGASVWGNRGQTTVFAGLDGYTRKGAAGGGITVVCP